MKKYNEIFWGEIAPSDHLLQVYENDETVIKAISGFAGSGFLAGDSVIIIATQLHIEMLSDRLKNDFDLPRLKSLDQYIPLEAEVVLSEFIENSAINEEKFRKVINALLQKARKGNRKVRVFGEMVALLLEKGNIDATLKLEELWSRFCKSDAICLFCAYPAKGFHTDLHSSIKEICAQHSKMIENNTVSAAVNLYGQNLPASPPFVISVPKDTGE